MSDGPHRSLPMPPGWKKLAECADKRAFSDEEVCDRLRVALEKDWRKEMPDALVCKFREILSDNQTDFFCNQTTHRLKLLRKEAAGYPIRGLFLDNTIRAVEQGHSGDKVLIEAVRQVLSDYAVRRVRQVEEHYLRKSTQRHTTHVTQRIKDAIGGWDSESTGRRLLYVDKSEYLRASAKQMGLDDGVQL